MGRCFIEDGAVPIISSMLQARSLDRSIDFSSTVFYMPFFDVRSLDWARAASLSRHVTKMDVDKLFQNGETSFSGLRCIV